MASYAAVQVFLILGLLATSCFAQDPGAEPTQPPSATPIPPTLSLNAVEFDKYHGEGTSLFQLKYCIDCGEKMTTRVHPGAAPTQLPSATPTPPTLSLNAIEFGKYHLDGEGSPLGKLKYCLDGEKKMTMRVHPGEFFRERMLTEGVMIQMVDLSDNLPKMSFLPENALAKLSPFSTSNIHKMMKVLNVSVSEDGRVEKMMRKSLALCEGSAGPGEVRKCVKSMSEMIAFVKSILGKNVVVRRTANVNGSGKTMVIGKVTKLNGGKVTVPVTCHKHLFPYMLLYYCHSNPSVRLYQVDLIEPKKNEKINQAIAICHIDTRHWSSDHPAFRTLGFGPGLIEACHWVTENELSWAVADNEKMG